MIFRKKKKMIDIRELQKRSVVRIPKEDIVIPTNKEGFVEFGNVRQINSSNSSQETNRGFSDLDNKKEEFTNPLDFLDSNTPSPGREFSIQEEGYNKREVDSKIFELDNKIYKLEQRIELLERKAGVNDSSDSTNGVMGW
tara:strand:+ start:3014 stop:3433 length:420 start_codon:yes stop_codon:yes gene_type:complete